LSTLVPFDMLLPPKVISSVPEANCRCFADHNDGLALATLVFPEPPIEPCAFMLAGLT
jgi:hypothetical protein